MPIANCIITSECQKSLDSSSNLIELWASESKKSPEHMTINIITSSQQLGSKYTIMANLLLPLEEVFVSTNIVNSGMIVEAGEEIEW